MGEQKTEQERCPDGMLADSPPGAIILIGALLGQRDGRVEISDRQVAFLNQMEVAWWRDHSRRVWVYELRPAKRPQ